MRKTASIFLIIIMIITLTTTVGFAQSSPSTSKDETVYAFLNNNGSVSGITVVNRLYTASGNPLTDYGNYSEIVNLTNDLQPKVTGDTIVFEGIKEIYYEGKTTGELPYTVSIKYFLDDKEVEGASLVGANGKIKIEMEVAPNLNASEELRKGLMAQISCTISMEKAKNLNVQNGFYVVAGKSYNISFVAMGQNPSKFELEFDANDFEMSSININCIKSSFNADEIIGDTKEELLTAFDDIADGVTQAKEGTQELQSGTKDLTSAISKLSGGLNTLSNSGSALVNGAGSFAGGIDTMAQSLPQLVQGSSDLATGLGTYAQGMPLLLQGYIDINTGATALLEGHNKLNEVADTAINTLIPAYGEITPALNQVAPALNQIVPALEQLVQAGMLPPEVVALVGQSAMLMSSSSELISQSSKLVGGMAQGIKAETEGISQIANGLSVANTEFAKANTGVATLNTSFAQLNSGIQLLPTGVQSLKDGFIQINDGIVQYTSGVSEVANGATSLKDNTSSLPADVQKLVDGQGEIVDGVKEGKTEINEKIDNFSKDSDLPPVSFASTKNTPDTVQYMMHTPEIYKEEATKQTQVEEDNRNFFEKLADLFLPKS